MWPAVHVPPETRHTGRSCAPPAHRSGTQSLWDPKSSPITSATPSGTLSHTVTVIVAHMLGPFTGSSPPWLTYATPRSTAWKSEAGLPLTDSTTTVLT